MKTNYLKIILLTVVLFSISSVATAQNKKKKNQALATGEVFKCDFETIVTGIPNYFRIKASKNTDACVRLMDKATDKCVRYAFINAGDTYDMKGVPEGKYYVKIGLGKEWIWNDSANCLGQFKQNAIYEKMSRTLDFNIKGSKNNQRIPSHELDLDMKVTKGKAEPNELISAKEFQR